MTKPKRNYHLTPDETLIVDIRPHWVSLVPAGAKALATVILWTLASSKLGGWVGTVAGYVTGAAAAFFTAAFVVRVTKWWFTHFAVTSERIIVRSGVVARKGIEIPLDRVNTVFFEQSALERLLRAGDIAVESASEQGRQTFFDIKNPQLVQQTIYRAREQARESQERRNAHLQGSVIADVVRGQDAATELQKLIELKDSGRITEAEYEALKRRIIG